MRKLFERFEAMLAAVSFAEEGEVDAARRILREPAEAEPPEERRNARTWTGGAPLAKGTRA